MKNLKGLKIVYILVLILLLGACSDKLLNPTPESVLTTNNTYKKAKDIKLALLGTYNRLQNKVQSDYLLMETPSDNVYADYVANSPGLPEIESLDISVDNEIVNDFWQECYNTILRANMVLSNIDKPSDYSEGQKSQYIGEAKFLRALYYFDLIRIFGDVPLVLEKLSIEESKQRSRAPKEQIVDKITTDLKDAISKLPEPSIAQKGRASKAAAASLLGKIYVNVKEWGNAKKYLEMIVNDYNYSLTSNFGDLFSLNTENNSEVILSVPFVEGTDTQGLSSQFLPNEGVFNMVTSGDRELRPTYDLLTLYNDEDTRLPETITTELLPYNASPDDPTKYYPYISKYLVPHTLNQSPLDLNIYRLGDIVLLYAEALYKTGSPTEAIEQINLIRERAFNDEDHNYQMSDFSDQESFMDLLLKERRLELAFESKRWFDLVRTGRFTNVLENFETEYSGQGDPLTLNLDPKPFMQYFPIPNRQIQIADSGVLTQNEGY